METSNEPIIVKCKKDKWNKYQTDNVKCPVEGFYYEVLAYSYSDDQKLFIVLKELDPTTAWEACNFDFEELEIKITSLPKIKYKCSHLPPIDITDSYNMWAEIMKGEWEKPQARLNIQPIGSNTKATIDDYDRIRKLLQQMNRI